MASQKELEDAAGKLARENMARQIAIDQEADKITAADPTIGRRKALQMASDALQSVRSIPKKADKPQE